MNVLIVDDQAAIVDRLKEGIRWDRLPVDHVYTANSTIEAKLIIVNFQIDLLITDIEMPGEDGIALSQWARDRSEELEIVFLTAHPDFSYARQAVSFRVFDYILQPAKYTDIEQTIGRVEEVLQKKKTLQNLKARADMAYRQSDAMMDKLIIKCQAGRERDVETLWNEIIRFYTEDRQPPEVYMMLIDIQHWLKYENDWPDSLVVFSFTNVLQELLGEDTSDRVSIANVEPGKFWVFFLGARLTWERIRSLNLVFFDFMKKYSDFRASIYIRETPVKNDVLQAVGCLRAANANNTKGAVDIFYVNDAVAKQEEQNPVERIIAYVHDSVWKRGSDDLNRSEVAAHVHMNPEYMSRLFKERTGISFKDYVLQEKMKFAEKLLRETNMSVSVIAGRVGFSNFSHFSNMYQRFYGDTPMEYRRKKNTGQ